MSTLSRLRLLRRVSHVLASQVVPMDTVRVTLDPREPRRGGTGECVRSVHCAIHSTWCGSSPVHISTFSE